MHERAGDQPVVARGISERRDVERVERVGAATRPESGRLEGMAARDGSLDGMVTRAAPRVVTRAAPRVRAALWPLVCARQVWTSAVASDARIRWNLRLLATLTAVFSVPDLVQGVLTWTHSAPGGGRLYGAYIVALGLLELAGALLLAVRVRGGRWLILAAAAGFYLEAALGLAGLQRSLLAAAIFAMCVPAEAWVIWFLCHPSVRTYLAAGRERPQRRCLTASP